MAETVDELFDTRNALLIGNYQACITEAQKSEPSTPELKNERNVLLYRAMVAQRKFTTVKSEITADKGSDLQAVKRLATYLHKTSDRAEVLAAVKKQQDDGISFKNPIVANVAATILALEQSYGEALRCLHQSDYLENIALTVQLLLKLDRVDLAKKELKRLQTLDEDATCTQLATAWVNLATGGDKLQEAYYIFQELADKYTPTPLLLNGQASCYMMQGKFEDAEQQLLHALEKNSSDPDTLINLAVVSQYTGKGPEVSQRYLTQLREAAPDHPFLQDLDAREHEFDRIAEQFGQR